MSARSRTEVPADLKPLPRRVQWWRRTRDRRRTAYQNLKNAGARLLTLAFYVLGATLVSYGVWMIYAPLGFIVGGLVVWLLLWSYEKDKGRSG